MVNERINHWPCFRPRDLLLDRCVKLLQATESADQERSSGAHSKRVAHDRTGFAENIQFRFMNSCLHIVEY